MAEFNINLLELTRQVFQLGSISIPLGGLPSAVEYGNVEVIDLNGNYPKSQLFNNPVFDTVYFNRGQENEFFLDDCPVISIRRPKHIVKSRVRNRQGTVKELINLGDFQGEIRGVIYNHESDDPHYDRIEEINELNNLTKEWEVEGDLFNALNIFNIVITDIQFPGAVGLGNAQPYLIQFESDEPIILSI